MGLKFERTDNLDRLF
ncbi:SPJ_0845 family protein, partial [Salmonella enterica]